MELTLDALETKVLELEARLHQIEIAVGLKEAPAEAPGVADAASDSPQASQ